MDPIFDFILEGEPHEPAHQKGTFSAHGHEQTKHTIPGSPTSCLPLDLCGPSSPSNDPSPSQQNEIEEINDEYISSVANNGHPISAVVRDTSIALIEEYLQDSIPLKAFLQKVCLLSSLIFSLPSLFCHLFSSSPLSSSLSPPSPHTYTLMKIRGHLLGDSDRKDIFDWFIRSMISCGHSARMSSFLEENGIKKEEIEAASVQPDGNYSTPTHSSIFTYPTPLLFYLPLRLPSSSCLGTCLTIH